MTTISEEGNRFKLGKFCNDAVYIVKQIALPAEGVVRNSHYVGQVCAGPRSAGMPHRATWLALRGNRGSQTESREHLVKLPSI